jgi:hypothetical protein
MLVRRDALKKVACKNKNYFLTVIKTDRMNQLKQIYELTLFQVCQRLSRYPAVHATFANVKN